MHKFSKKLAEREEIFLLFVSLLLLTHPAMNPKEPFVITISREIGSGGRTIGRILSQKLHTLYFDKDLIHSLEERFNLTASGIEKLKAQKKNWLSEFIQFVTPMPSAKTLGVDSSFTHEFRIDVTPDDIYKAETEILKELAREGSCFAAAPFRIFVTDLPKTVVLLFTGTKKGGLYLLFFSLSYLIPFSENIT